MRVALAIALLSVLMPGQGMAQRRVAVADGETIPELRPCIDYAARGWLRMTGEADPDPDPVAMVDHPTYHFRFTPRRLLFGASRQPFKLYRTIHAPRFVDVKNALVLVHSRPNGDLAFDAWEWIWTDRRGRSFIPVFEWPQAEYRGANWKPMAFRRFAKLVSYADPQPYWPDVTVSEHQLLDDQDTPEEERLFAVNPGRRFRVRYGLYLSDLAAMFAAADAEEDCWR